MNPILVFSSRPTDDASDRAPFDLGVDLREVWSLHREGPRVTFLGPSGTAAVDLDEARAAAAVTLWRAIREGRVPEAVPTPEPTPEAADAAVES